MPEQISPEVREKVKQTLGWTSSELGKRYEECDSEGHYAPDEKKNICHHCYRRFKIDTPFFNQKYSKRKYLHPFEIPCDAPVLIDELKKEVEHERHRDWFNGMGELSKLLLP